MTVPRNSSKSDPYELYQNAPELRAKPKILAERLDGPIIESDNNHFFYQGGMQDFLHAGLLTNTNFINMASSLSDEALEDFAQMIKTLYLPATENFTSHNEANRTYQDKITQFTDVLLNSSEENRNTILEKAASYAEQVDRGHLRAFKTTVLSQDISQFSKPQRYRDDTSANNLHNYITAIIDSDNPIALTKQLGKMSDEAQTGLLSVSGLDTGLIEPPYIEEGLTVVALEGAAVFQDMDTAIDNSRVPLGATNNVKMVFETRRDFGESSDVKI